VPASASAGLSPAALAALLRDNGFPQAAPEGIEELQRTLQDVLLQYAHRGRLLQSQLASAHEAKARQASRVADPARPALGGTA
jgi:hypothetical protein